MKKLLLIFCLWSTACQAQYIFNGWKYRGGGGGGSNGLAAINTFYAKLDEASGNLVDSKNANNGTKVVGSGTTTYSATGKLNTAISTSTGTAWTFGDAVVNQFTSQGSISAWIFPTAITGVPLIVNKGNFNTDRNGYMLGLSGGKPFFELANASAVNQLTVNQTLSTSTWYHIVITWDGSNIKGYVDGTLITTISQTVNATSSGINLSMFAGWDGTTYDGFHFLGTIDEVALFNDDLTATQVSTIYNSGTPLPFASYN